MAAASRRLLLVSCEFDADASPQGLRWVKLGRELARQGWLVDVVTLDPNGARYEAPGVHVHRVFPGPYRGTIDAIRRRLGRFDAPPAQRPPAAAAAGVAPPMPGPVPERLSWKGRLELALRRMLEYWMYPDLRREALPFLRARVRRLLRAHSYAGVVLSHEPALALELIDRGSHASVPVIADLGDPVCATYTPKRWRRRALRLERKVCRTAAAVVATSRATLALLRERHGELPASSLVVNQGFDPGSAPGATGHAGEGGPLRLVYTGRFYRFRNPRAVIDAVREVEGIRLVLALPEIPDDFDPDWLRAPNIEVHIRLSHAEAKALQATADVLLVVGNDDAAQIPGKLFEYFALPVPVLYATNEADDEGAALLVELARGLVVRKERAAIVQALRDLRGFREGGGLGARFDLSPARVSAYAWPALARRYGALLETLGLQPPVQ